MPYAVEGFVSLAAQQGQAERAMVLAGAAEAARELLGTPLPPAMKSRLDRALALARARLSGPEESAWARGRAMSFDEAVAEALRDA